jgi:glycosyltransferase involved in cell wall biosynthesis
VSDRKIAVVVPTRKDEDAEAVLESLASQTIADQLFVVVAVDVESRGAPATRNRGAREALKAGCPYLLFCDDDIEWEPDGIERMYRALEGTEWKTDPNGWTTAYAYGGYVLYDDEGRGCVVGNEPWDLRTLLARNFVSTMSLMRTEFYPGWDETLKRLQDWDLWIEIAKQRGRGLWVGGTTFRTRAKPGITFHGTSTYEEAWAVVRRKHGLAV